ncbi:MAG: hypothetical protein JSS95_01900 [Acidobacteria bacterium]|nr:hypothetical protein [Acidobacteriota bacterium]
MAGKKKSPLHLWHLLSLDAPTVATLWTWFITRVNHIHLNVSSLLAMAAAVWMLYAADRLLDGQATSHTDALEARHHFHYRHRNAFLTGIAIASIVLALLLPRIPIEAIRLYLVLGGLVFGYFVVIHATSSAHRLPKEIAVGICFAAAVFIPTVARQPNLRGTLLPSALLFAALCSLNCLFIYAWEHPSRAAQQQPHALTAAALRHLSSLAAAVGTASAVVALLHRHTLWPISTAIALSAFALVSLHRERGRLDALTLRAIADFVLLTPALLAGLL